VTILPQTQDPSPPAPVGLSERIVVLDVLRGFALLGILVVNIQSFAMIEAAYFNPTAYGDLTGLNRVVWALTYVLFDQKFMTLFSIMFGAGVLLMTSRREAAGCASRALHYRRMGVLLLFGLVHAYLFWHGDILVYYAMCGAFVYAFRQRSPRFLMTLGLSLIAVASVILLLSGWSMPSWPAEEIAAFIQDLEPPPDKIAEELAAFRQDWLGQVAHRAPLSLEFEILIFLVWGFWRAGGLMLIGMALLKLDVVTAARSTRFYANVARIGLVTGIPIVAYSIYRNVQSSWSVRELFFFNHQFNYWGSLLVSAGWMGLVMLAVKSGRFGFITRRLAAVGRMALTNYLGHTIICTLIFYGHGLGLFGRVERLGQILIVLAIWALQLTVSPMWLRHFRFGPFEWLWRSLTYRRWQPMRIRPGQHQ